MTRINSFKTILTIFAAVGLMACEDDVDGVGSLDPQIEIDPALVDFGNIQVGTKMELRARISNPGTGVLTIGKVEGKAPFDDAFGFSIEDSDKEIAPGGVGIVTITFNPRTIKEYESVLLVKPKDEGLTTQAITIKGAGVTANLKIEPSVVSFGNVVVQTTKTIDVKITNESAIEADVEFLAGSNIKFCGSTVMDTSNFCLSTTSHPLSVDNRFKLGGGESTVLKLSFTPVIAGTRERGNFTLKACGESACESEINMDGLGIVQGFRCNPPDVAFGQVNPGSCVTEQVSCENIANERVTVIDWGASLGGGTTTSADFSIEAFTTAVVLNEGDKIDVDVTYCPNELGQDTGTLVIETDNSDPRRRYVNIELAGTGGGPDIEVTPVSLNFGQVSLIAPARRTISIQNVGYADLEITEILVDTMGTGAFIAPGASGRTIAVGEFYDITVEFQPTSEGPVSSELIIRSSDQDEPEIHVTLQGEGINLPPCSFEVVPETMSFGVVERGRTVGRAFEIRNTGTSDCLVTSARMLPGSDIEFSLPDGDVQSLIIPPASAATVRIEYAPAAIGTNSGSVEFSISSPTSPFNTVALSGTSDDASLLIVPNDLAFGTIGVGCAARSRIVTIYNTGTTPSEISSIALAAPGNPAFSLPSLPAPLPGAALSLAPGASTSFEVGFRADAISSYAAAVEITGTFNGNAVTYLVSLQGRGATDATQIDEFDQLGRPKVDLLFVIDDSCSMSQEQAALASNFEAFIQFATAQAIDYQIGVTTTDINQGQTREAGRLVPITGNPSDRIVTPRSQPSPEQLFQQNANIGIDSGTYTEKGLEGAYLALSNPLIFGHNAGFLRQDAVLSIIFVSDEEDQSLQTVDFYINFFLSIKGFRNNNLFTASAIVGDSPGGCNGAGGSAQAGSRYVEVANRTGGVFQSICTADWSRALEDLSTTAFGFKSRYFLTNQPVLGPPRGIGTIKVFVDAVEIPDQAMGGTINWTYDYPTNTINFSPFATPEPGSHIRVEYVVECL